MLLAAVFLATVAALLLGWSWWTHRPVVRPPGVLAPADPVQAMLPQPQPAIRLNGAILHPLATFAITARVLSRADYSHDTESTISPTDLALGWGRMSDSAVLSRIDIGQEGRFYLWSTARFPIPRREIETHSANMHIVPGSAYVADELLDVRRGDVVTMDGYLIEADRPGGWHWRSSLTRRDVGDGACELFYVQDLSIAPH